MGDGVAKVVNRLREAQENGKLDLSECGLTQIPDAVYMMMKDITVQSCDLSQNLLQSLPKKFCSKFSKVTEMNISGNKLHTLPDELRNLQELQDLDASSNNLDRIPQVVFQCVKLKQLNVHSNCISEVDVMRLEAMDSLETLNIKGNPLPDDVKSQLSDSRLNIIKS
ncbi:leucine-rich repeat-containing protein 40-like [Mytilus californianus]|uniref:leucine-rich repeat-containing protein 40-like n=1 Tax=Mytilus californianus TaxID=6549 RepID=UPI002246E4B2|nr:leucine-rich repeat-containing protein 40-like [Mytilus californianus]